MNILELIEELDTRFGNQYAPKHYLCIQQAVAELKSLLAENAELKAKLGQS